MKPAKPQSLAQRIALYSTLLALVLVLLAGGGSWLLLRHEQQAAYETLLAKEIELHASRIGSRIRTVHGQLAKAARSSLISTALVDSAGKDAYLVPYLQGLRQVEGIPVAVVFADFEGKEIARNGAPGITGAHFEWLAKQLAAPGNPAAIFGAGETAELVVAELIYYSRAKMPVAALLYRIKLSELIDPQVRLHWSGDGTAPGQAAVVQTLDVPGALKPLGIFVELRDSSKAAPPAAWSMALFFLVATLAASGVALWTSRRIAEHLTRDLRGLSVFAGEVVAAGFGERRAELGGTTEVAELASAVNTMLDRLNELHERLKDESEAMHRSLVKAMAEGVVFQAADGRITAVNPAAERILGRSLEQMLGRSADGPQWDAIHEDGGPFPAELHPAMLTLRSGAPVSDVTMGIRRPDGTLAWISANSQPLISAGATTPYAVVTTFHDITERKRAEEALHRLNRELRAISNCNQALMRAEDEQTLLDDICRIVCDEAGYRMAWVGYAEHDDARSVRPVAWGGFEGGYVANAKLSWADDTERGRGPAGMAIRGGENIYVQDFADDARMTPWRESALQRGYRSGIALPLKDEEAKVFGVLLIYSAEANAMTPEEIRLLEELAGDLAFGITVLRERIERREAEEALRKSELGLKEAQQLAHIGSWDWDAVNDTIRWSAEYFHLYGLDPDKPTPNYTEHLRAYTPESAERLDAAVKRAMDTGEAYGLDLELALPTESTRWIFARGEVKRDADGKIRGLRGTAQNITERKADEQTIRGLNAKLSATLQAIPDLLFELDGNGIYLDIWAQNPTLLARQKELLLGHGIAEMLAPDAARTVMAAIGEAGAKGCSFGSVIRLDLAGDSRWFELSVSRKDDTDRAETHFIVLSRDITERKRAEDTVRTLNQELERRVAERTDELESANRELEAFAYSVSHDLRAPLRAINGFSQILTEDYRGQLDEEGRHYVDTIGRNAVRMGELIDDILAFSRMSRRDMAMVPVDMRALAKEVFEEVRGAAPQRNIVLRLGELPPAQGDRAMIRQVLVNLLANAVKFTAPRGEAVIEVDGVAEGDDIAYRVKDNGAGFDMQYVDMLFGVFQRLHSAEEFEGTGIGLAIVKRIVARHGGRVWAEGKLDEGATFYFTLPRAERRDV